MYTANTMASAIEALGMSLPNSSAQAAISKEKLADAASAGAAVVEFMWQIIDGRMGYIGTVRDDVPFVTGRPSTSFRQWATDNRETLLRLAKG